MGKRVFFTLLILVWGIFPFACDFCGTGGGSCPCDMPKVYDFRALSMQAQLYDHSYFPATDSAWHNADSLTIAFSLDKTETVYAANPFFSGQHLYACSPAEPQPLNGIVRFNMETAQPMVLNGDTISAETSLNDYFHFGINRNLGLSYKEHFERAHRNMLDPWLNAFGMKN